MNPGEKFGRNSGKIKARLTAALLLVLMTVSTVSNSAIAFAATYANLNFKQDLKTSDAENHFGIIAILVDEDTWNDPNQYVGLLNVYPNVFNAATLQDRIRRYAIDAQRSQEYTKSVIIKIKKTDTVPEISDTLEKLYLEGDGTPGQLNKLAGVVIVGDVQLPVVNKNGNRFVSMLPYTDFVDKAYVYDPATDDFVQNQQMSEEKPEVWSGIIKPPIGGNDGKELLATYLDKNYLYHCKDITCNAASQNFKVFARKLFYADLVNEFKLMNKSSFGNYTRFLANIEDLTYNRYTRKLLLQLMGQFNEDLKKSTAVDTSDTSDADLASEGISKQDASKLQDPVDINNSFKDKNGNAISPEDAVKDMPDIKTKDLIDQFAAGYDSLFDKFKANVNDWTNFTGRYQSSYTNALGKKVSDVSSIPILVAAKDEYARNYLKAVNDAIETKMDSFAYNADPNQQQLQAPITLLENSKVVAVGQIKGGSKSAPWTTDFTNFKRLDIEYATFFDWLKIPLPSIIDGSTPIPGDKVSFINGIGFPLVKSVLDCTLNRGSNTPGGQMVEANHVYDVNVVQDDNNYFMGCQAGNMDNPQRCFPVNARAQVYDPAGTRAIDPNTKIGDSATNYQSCFNFMDGIQTTPNSLVGETGQLAKYDYALTAWLAWLQQVYNATGDSATDDQMTAYEKAAGLPVKPWLDPVDTVIVNFNGAAKDVTLGDIAQKIYNLDPHDNRAIGAALLAKTGTYTFTGAQLGRDDLDYVGLIVTPKVLDFNNGLNGNLPTTKVLSSYTANKEPTLDTLITQSSNLKNIPNSLPVDNPRYFSFQDKNGNYRKVTYPNLFAVKSITELETLLKSKEAELKQIATDTGVNIDVTDKLYDMVEGGSDVYENPAARDKIAVASKDKLIDAYNWLNMNIDQKHEYILNTYLSQLKDPITAGSPSGYEAMYLIANGSADTMDYNFNGDIPQDDNDPMLKKAGRNTPPPKTAPDNNSGSNVNLDEPVDIFSWIGAIKDWTKKTFALQGGFGAQKVCTVSDSTSSDSGQTDNSAGGGGAGNNVSLGANAQDAAQATVKLLLKADKDVIKTGAADTVTVTVEGLDTSGHLVTTDNFTQVNLIIKNPANGEVAKVSSTNPIPLIGGIAQFTLTSTDIEGTFSVTANSTNKSGLSANVINIKSTARKLRLTSYVEQSQSGFDNLGSNGFIIKGENDKPVASINPKTGMITILDNDYQLVAIQASGNRPTRLGVQKKDTLKVWGSVFFVGNNTKIISIDPTGTDFLTGFSSMNGVHIKPFNDNQSVGLKRATSDQTGYAGDVFLMQNINGQDQKVGIIDQTGNIFLDDSLTIDYNNTSPSDGPVLFDIKDKNGNKLFEVYVGVTFSKIQVVQEQGNYANFNVIAFLPEPIRNFFENPFIVFTAQAVQSVVLQDRDNDGIPDVEELLIGTNVYKPDTNGDGLSDNQDLMQDLSPVTKDKKLFSDMTPKDEGYDDVIELLKRGVVQGYSDGTFKPNQDLSREEFVKLDLGAICIVSCDKFPDSVKKSIDDKYKSSPFPDKNIDANLQYCVKEGKNRSIISGYQGGAQKGFFLPKNNISRAEAAKVVLETAKQDTNSNIQIPNYPVGNGPWYYDYILAAQQYHVFPKGRFDQLDNLSPADFRKWFDGEIANPNSKFMAWIEGKVPRVEFAMMVRSVFSIFDCMKEDTDNDGLPDNIEKYVYGIDPNNPNNGNGRNGLSHLDQIIKATYPEDFANANGNGTNGNNNGNANGGNSDANNPNSNLDTDGGGVTDYDEIHLQHTNPLDKSDDHPGASGTEGAYAVGNNNISENYIYGNNTTSSGSNTTTDLQFEDQVPADGFSRLILQATIIGSDEQPDTSDSSSVIDFSAVDGTDTHATVLKQSIKAKNGQAQTVLEATKLAGNYIATASVENDNIPVENQEINVHALDPSQIIITPQTKVIRSGGKSYTPIHVDIKDGNGNLATNGIYNFTFKVDGPGKINDSLDEDKNTDGIQMSTMEGKFDFDLYSTADAGQITLTATYNPNINPEDAGSQQTSTTTDTTDAVTSSVVINSRDDLRLALIPNTLMTVSDYQSGVKLKVEAIDKNNNIIEDFRGTSKLTVLNTDLGSISDTNVVPIVNGIGTATFMPTNVAGTATISATMDGFDPVNAEILVLPKQASQVKLEAESTNFNADGSEQTSVTAKLYDNDGNFVNYDSTTQVTFQLTQVSQAFAKFVGPSTVTAKNGVATVMIAGTNKTGPVNLIASLVNGQMATVQLNAVKKYSAITWRKNAPNVLYASVLGADFGNVMKDNYMAGWMVFADQVADAANNIHVGKMEAATSLLSDPNPHAKVVEITSTGKINLQDTNNYGVNVVQVNAAAGTNKFVIENLSDKNELAEVYFKMKPQSRVQAITAPSDIKPLQDGIYVQAMSQEKDYTLTTDTNGLNILDKGKQVALVNDSGAIQLFDDSLQLEYDTSGGQYPQINFKHNGSTVAEAFYVATFTNDVKVLEAADQFRYDNADSGVYIKKMLSDSGFGFETAFSGNSTANAKGIYITDLNSPLPQNQAPTEGYTSLDKAGDKLGVGFTGDNKHMLLFAAGNSVGESNMPYSSEIGVVIGDPTVRIDNSSTASSATGFTKDIGKELMTGNETIQTLTAIDYNTDGLKDVLVGYEDGKVRLLENTRGYPKFVDKGIFMDFPNGILSMDTGDFNGDGQQDLVIATKDSCKKGEVCVDLYLNHSGNFERVHLDLASFNDKNRVYMVKAVDVNNDGYPDLVTSDDSGAVRVFYNMFKYGGTFDPNGQYVGSLGLHIDNTTNYKSEVAVQYDGSPVNDPTDPADDENFIQLKSTDEKDPSDFVYLDLDKNLGIKSAKVAADLTEPKDVIQKDDEVGYTIYLYNSGSSTLNSIRVSDVVPDSVDLETDSISCAQCGTGFNTVETGESLRPMLFQGFSMAPGKVVTITYKVKITKTPKIILNVGKNLSKTLPQSNSFPDIAATPDGNPTGRMTYFYPYSSEDNSTTGGTRPAKVFFKTLTTAPPDPVTVPVDTSKGGFDIGTLNDLDENGVPNSINNFAQQQQDQQTANLKAKDSGIGGALDSIGDDLQSAINSFSCSTGCIPMPINYSFLTPGMINVMGIPGGADPGVPVFGWAIPSLPFVCSGPACYASLGGRIYLSPTLTGSVAAAVCLGPYAGLASPCWAHKVFDIISALGGSCDEIAGDINGVLAKANDLAQSTGTDSSVSTNGGVTGADGNGRQATGGFSGSKSLGNYQYKASVSTNIRIPGFPSVLTDWLDRQTQEVVNKLTTLPNIYFIYPDFKSIAGSVVPTDDLPQANQSNSNTIQELDSQSKLPKASTWNSFRQVLSYVNSIPLVQIQAKDVLIKIPAITRSEVNKWQADSRQWLDDERNEVNRVLALWCGSTYQLDANWNTVKSAGHPTQYASACEKLLADTTALANSINKNIQTLEKYKALPYKVIDLINSRSKYAYQIICYLDAIIKLTGGYIKKQQVRIQQWIDMVRKIVQVIKDWKPLVDLSIDYNASCDKCTSARFTLLELIVKLFAVIPSPPIIPFPKLPDIYIDVSQIQAGVKIMWPDIKFRPIPLIIPKLPRIYLPDIPSLEVTLPSIPVIPPPPDLPTLPDLPPLPMPTLPDLPPPPKVPEFPVSIKAVISVLKKLMRILCILKQGIMPVPEGFLKSHVEQLTERPLTPLLPFDLGLKFQLPTISYDYIDTLKVTTYLNLSLNFDGIYNFVQNIADKANAITTDLTKTINNASKAVQNGAQNAAGAANNTGNAVNGGGKTVKISDNSTIDPSNPKSLYDALLKSNPYFASAIDEYHKSYAQLQKDAAAYQKVADNVKDIKLVASQQILSGSDPILNRSVTEVKNDIGNDPVAEFTNQKRWVAMRNNLIALSDQTDKLVSISKQNPDMAGTVLAQLPTLGSSLDNIDGDKFYASNSEIDSTGSVGTRVEKLVGTALTEFGNQVKNEVSGRINYYAAAGLSDTDLANSQQKMDIVYRGIYVVNQQSQTSERLINYTDEIDDPTKILFIDIDNDKDNDVLYSYGGNLYLKENYKNSPTRVYVDSTPKDYELSQFEPAHGAVTEFGTNFNNNNAAELTWSAANYNGVSGYDMYYKPMPDAFEQDLGAKTHHVAAIIQRKLDKTQTTFAVPDAATFKPSSVDYAYLSADQVQGEVYFDGLATTIVTPDIKGVKVQPGQTIHALVDSTLQFELNGGDEGGITIPKNTEFTLPDKYTQAVDLAVIGGGVEIIDSKQQATHQRLFNGMKLDFDDQLYSENGGSASVNMLKDSYVRVNPDEDLLLKQLLAPNTPDLQLKIPNGFYYAKLYSFDTLGRRSTGTEAQLMAPSICADKQAPIPNGGPSTRNVPILKQFEINAADSFDPNSEITDYWLDTDLNTDSDHDGDPTDDKDIDNGTNPKFVLGPYTTLDQRKVKLNVANEANYSAGQEIDINVYVPDVTLDPLDKTLTSIKGKLSTKDSGEPISLFRSRHGNLEKIVTKSANSDGKYLTDENGEFAVNDLNLNDTLVVKDSAGAVVAQLDQNSGRISTTAAGYTVEVLPAIATILPTRVVLKDKTGKIMFSIYLVADGNSDVVTDRSDTVYNSDTIAQMHGVHLKDDQSGDARFTYKSMPATDEIDPGAVKIFDTLTQKNVAILEPSGNFYALDPNVKLSLKDDSDLTKPLVVNVSYNSLGQQNLIGEFYVSKQAGQTISDLSPNSYKFYSKSNVQNLGQSLGNQNSQSGNGNTADANNILGNGSQQTAQTSQFDINNGFVDVTKDNPYYQNIMDVSGRGVFTSEVRNGLNYFNPDKNMTRAEFADIMLKLFCIVPRKEAYEAPAVFSDMPFERFKNDPSYAIIKEAYLQGFVTGYLGEVNSQGLSPFKPLAPITRAEATKVIIEALKREKAINLGTVKQSAPWYAVYMQIAQNLQPYLANQQAVKQTFIDNADESAKAVQNLTRAEFAAMADRVLKTYDCTIIDSDGDGMPDYWETKHGLNPNDPNDANLDPDNDGLTNLEEFQYGTDPNEADTDHGGVTDGDEVKKYHTDPLNAADDNLSTQVKGMLKDYNNDNTTGPIALPINGIGPGYFGVLPKCTKCPCDMAIDHSADFVDGDKIYAVISSPDENTIYAKSNEIDVPPGTNP